MIHGTGTSGARLPGRIDPVAAAVAARQDDVVTTAQLQAWGVQRSLVARRVSSGEWQRVFRGVVVLHSGPVTWRQRARGALLCAGNEAALSHRSAAFVHGLVPRPGADLVVSVPGGRTVSARPGLVVHRRNVMPFAGGALRVVGTEPTVLDLLDGLESDDEVVGLLCDAIRQGVVPGRLLLHARQRPRVRHRALLLELLDEPGRGIESPLEHRYARDVEARHGLPRAQAQVSDRVDGRWIRADRVHKGLGVRIELDGQLAHPFGRTDDDTWRDNAVLIALGDVTLRYRWRHVVADPCATAVQVVAALRSRGWTGLARPCADTCPVRPTS
ncbi:type IV toxin-antitoxin system AbiEi family antitoxin domain-containing protein [Cellulomonas humilata]|uniref:Type IV toxin-antitoxin system AbiEi family antitoxin domain-containing protein n=1 Tax=Cellulomonas humilata TaxID=144055 RepID=A0A7Y6DZH0_9CELL|nr:type IV toxin-antitoxin system AbiEi family antitoxin domain-containing protein [Cellulomonas humilata]NUU19029.1 type IV toxin-antitoxin system AbiEi family antitoxin domain-containing protein [Cellulomonas humilata]